jgi:hypothetical protein
MRRTDTTELIEATVCGVDVQTAGQKPRIVDIGSSSHPAASVS